MLQRGQGIALWRQIERRIADDIAAGLFAGGARLPTEPELAARFGVNRHTLRRAMAALAERGLVRIEQGRGTFIQESMVDYLIGKRTRFSEIVSAQNRQPGGRLLKAHQVPATLEVAAELQVGEDSACIYLENLGEVDGQPLSLSGSYFPAARFPDLIAVFSETQSITRALARHGVGDYQRKVTRVTARLPEAREADELRQSRLRPVLVVESVNVDGRDRPIQFSTSRFAADRTQLVFET